MLISNKTGIEDNRRSVLDMAVCKKKQGTHKFIWSSVRVWPVGPTKLPFHEENEAMKPWKEGSEAREPLNPRGDAAESTTMSF